MVALFRWVMHNDHCIGCIVNQVGHGSLSVTHCLLCPASYRIVDDSNVTLKRIYATCTAARLVILFVFSLDS